MSTAVFSFRGVVERSRAWLPSSSTLGSLPVLVGVLAVAPYLSLLLSGDLILADCPYSDYDSFQVPMREFVQSEFSEGRFPHWIPWVGCGLPLHAIQQNGICYPLMTPFLVLFSANFAIKFSLLLHIILAYTGLYRLARSLDVGPAGAALSGLIFAQNGFLTSHLAVGHIAMTIDCGLLPWFFFFLVSNCRSPSWSSITGVALTLAGFLLAGSPQVPYYALLTGGLWVTGSLLWGSASARRIRVCGLFVVGMTVGVLLGAIQLLPALELMRENNGMSPRGSIAFAGDYALDGLDLLRLIVPSIRGNPLAGTREYSPPDFYHEKVCYVGLLTWWLALVAMFRSDSPRWTRGAGFLVLFGLVISLGNSTSVFPLLGNIIPGLCLFRCPGRIQVVVAMFLAVLAGRGFELLDGQRGPSSLLSLRVTVIGVLIFDAFALLLESRESTRVDWNRLSHWGRFASEHLQSELHMSGIMALATLSFVCWNHRVPARSRCLLGAAILLVDLGYFNIRGIRYDYPAQKSPPADLLRDSHLYRFVEAPRYPQFSKDEVRYSRFVPLAVRSHFRMLGTNEGGVFPSSTEILFRNLQEAPEETLRQASCRYIVRNRGDGVWKRIAEPLPRLRVIPDSPDGVVQASPSPSTGAFSQETVRSESNAESATIQIVTDEPQCLIADIRTPVDGLFVVADTDYPGWSATLDGVPVEISRVAGSFRGIRVPAGDYQVRMEFRSDSFITGCKVSSLGAGMLLGLLWIGWYTSRRT